VLGIVEVIGTTESVVICVGRVHEHTFIVILLFCMIF